jgi:hypothetical protein
VTYFAAVFRNQVKYSFKWRIMGVLMMGFMFLMCVSSCKQEREPSTVLSEKQMVSVLTEIYLIEEKASRMGLSRDSVVEIFPKYRERVFTKLSLSDSSFKQSMDYYMAHPERLKRIYTALVDSLSFRTQATAVADSAKKNNVLPK